MVCAVNVAMIAEIDRHVTRCEALTCGCVSQVKERLVHVFGLKQE